MRRFLLKSIVISLALALAVSQIPEGSPLFVLNFPGWTIAFGVFFAAADTRTVKILEWLVYLGVNTLVWFGIIAVIGLVFGRYSKMKSSGARP